MLQSSAAYAPEVCSICSTAVAHMLQSIPHMTENTVLESDSNWKSYSTATFGDTYRHYHLPMTIYCFIGWWFGFWCLSCAPGLWRICCRGLQHNYAAQLCSICSRGVQHMLRSPAAYAPELWSICSRGYFDSTFSAVTLSARLWNWSNPMHMFGGK